MVNVYLIVILDINYFHCLRIVELLKETESSTKNIFGTYSSKRMKDWLEILKLYDKGNIYLGKIIIIIYSIVYLLKVIILKVNYNKFLNICSWSSTIIST